MQSKIIPIPSYTFATLASLVSQPLPHTTVYREAVPQPCLQAKRSTWLLGSRCDWLAAHRGPRAQQMCPKLPVCALKGDGRIDSSRTAAADILSQASAQGCWVASSELEETRKPSGRPCVCVSVCFRVRARMCMHVCVAALPLPGVSGVCAYPSAQYRDLQCQLQVPAVSRFLCALHV